MQQNIAHDLNEKHRTKDVILEENVTFTSLLLHNNIQKGLAASGFKKPSPIQFKSIPLGRCGFDLVVKSKSGTGKTLVFSTIALETVNVSRDYPQVLILVPTREIAVQIQDVLKSIGRHIEGLSIESFIGGLPVEEDIKKSKFCHIAVGAPGRVKHLINLDALITKNIRLFVLDEADKLLEPSFQNDINEIYDMLPHRKQMIATSATYPRELDLFLTKYMQSPTHVTSENETPLLLGLNQFVAVLKANTLNAVQQMKSKNEILLEVFSKVSFTQCLVFTNYQTRTESVSNFLNQKGWDSSFISAAAEQSERLEAINDLKNFKNRILLSTDLTSRGIDAPNVDLVINYDLPHDAVTYLHRMGRAGRYGSKGICINFALEGAELTKLQNILGTIGSTNLSISKMPPLNGNDLWHIDSSSLEQIWGLLPSENSNQINENIKKEVFALKQKNKKENVKQRKNDKKGKKKMKWEVLNRTENVQSMLDKKKEEMEKNFEGSSSTVLDTENLLNSLIFGDSVDDDSKKRRIELEGKTIIQNDIKNKQESLDTDDMDNSLNGENNAKKHKTEFNEISKPDIVQNILISKKREVDICFESSSMETEDLLSSLISESCINDDNNRRKMATDNETLHIALKSETFETSSDSEGKIRKNETVSKETIKFEDLPGTENVQNILMDKSRVREDFLLPSTTADTDNLLTFLVSRNESKKDIRNSSVELQKKKGTVDSKYSIFCKNKALLNVSKILCERNAPIDTDITESLEEYLKVLNSNDTGDNKMSSTDEILGLNDDSTTNVDFLKKEEVQNDTVDDMENIFKIGYNCMIKSEGKKWLDCIPREELQRFQDCCRAELIAVSSDSEDIEEEQEEVAAEDFEMQEYRNEVEEQNNATLQWVPVVEASVIDGNNSRNHFVQCFDDCSNVLWQTGLSFETVPEFDNWFYQWQEHLLSVRNYVQQNLYIEEMSKYQQNRLTNK